VDCAYGKILFLDLISGDTVYHMSNLPFGSYPTQVIAAGEKIYIAAQGPNIIVLQSMPSAVQQAENIVGVNLYPNPAHDEVDMLIHVNEASSLVANVMALNGKTVFQQDLGELRIGAHTFKFHLPELSPGLYFVQFQNEKGIVTKKLVIQ
jgi:hypothetical protein